MSDPADVNGWAPPDPAASGPTEPPAPQPHPQAAPQPSAGWPDQPPSAAEPAVPPAQPYAPTPQGWPSQAPGGYPQAPGGPPAAHPQPYGAYQPYPHPHPQGPPQPHGMAYPGYGPPVKRPWVVPAPSGVPFHRMARTAVHRWWRPLVGSLTILGGGIAAVIALMLIGVIVNVVVTGDVPGEEPGSGDSLFGDDTADLAFNLASIAIFLPVAVLVPWWIQRRRPGTLSSVAGRLRWRWMLVCCGLAVLVCGVSFGTSWLASLVVDDPSDGNDTWVGWGRFLAPAVVIILLVPFQAAAEEYVFRGWLLQAVGACTLENSTRRVGRALSVVFRTPWPGIVIGSALFTSGHGYTGWGILDIFAFGAIAAWITVRSGGLEAAIALHVFNNLLAFLMPAAVGELDIEQGSIAWQYVLADVTPMVLYAALIVWLVRRMRIQTVTVPTAADPGPDGLAAAQAPPAANADPSRAVDGPPGPIAPEAAER